MPRPDEPEAYACRSILRAHLSPPNADVRITTDDARARAFEGKVGTIFDVSQSYEGKYIYSVHILPTDVCCDFREDELVVLPSIEVPSLLASQA